MLVNHSALLDLAVIILNYNTRDLLRDCLRSLREQTGLTFETCVVDNASPDGSADMWMYLPELGRVRQLNAAARGESVMGTDLTFEDLSGSHLDVRTHRLLGEEELDGHATYKVESVPLEPSVYARVVGMKMPPPLRNGM